MVFIKIILFNKFMIFFLKKKIKDIWSLGMILHDLYYGYTPKIPWLDPN